MCSSKAGSPPLASASHALSYVYAYLHTLWPSQVSVPAIDIMLVDVSNCCRAARHQSRRQHCYWSSSGSRWDAPSGQQCSWANHQYFAEQSKKETGWPEYGRYCPHACQQDLPRPHNNSDQACYIAEPSKLARLRHVFMWFGSHITGRFPKHSM